MLWLHCQMIVGLNALVTLPKNCWTRVLGSVIIQLYASECTPSVDRALQSEITYLNKTKEEF